MARAMAPGPSQPPRGRAWSVTTRTVARVPLSGAAWPRWPRGRGGPPPGGGGGGAKGEGGGGSVIVTLDADGQHPPEEIPRLVAPIAEGRADLVLGARERTAAMPLGRRLTNRLSAALASRIGGQSIPDAQTGFRAFTAEIAALVRPTESHYEYEAAFLLEALARRVGVASIPIPTDRKSVV